MRGYPRASGRLAYELPEWMINNSSARDAIASKCTHVWLPTDSCPAPASATKCDWQRLAATGCARAPRRAAAVVVGSKSTSNDTTTSSTRLGSRQRVRAALRQACFYRADLSAEHAQCVAQPGVGWHSPRAAEAWLWSDRRPVRQATRKCALRLASLQVGRQAGGARPSGRSLGHLVQRDVRAKGVLLTRSGRACDLCVSLACDVQCHLFKC